MPFPQSLTSPLRDITKGITESMKNRGLTRWGYGGIAQTNDCASQSRSARQSGRKSTGALPVVPLPPRPAFSRVHCARVARGRTRVGRSSWRNHARARIVFENPVVETRRDTLKAGRMRTPQNVQVALLNTARNSLIPRSRGGSNSTI